MFTKAIKAHNANAVAPAQKPARTQQSLNTSFKRAAPAQALGTRPLSIGSGNVVKHNPALEQRPSGQARGLKRTSSGLAKALSSQDDAFDYGNFIMDNENAPPPGIFPAAARNPIGQDVVAFDDNDFDSDIDLDLEDPATKGSVRYPPLPPVSPTASMQSTYRPTSKPKQEPPSSAPVPWSSSPPEHHTQPTKRRTLPWLQKYGQSQATAENTLEDESEPDSQATVPSKKRKSTEAAQSSHFTPLPKNTIKHEYAWNTTASAIKQQQKALREANKKTVEVDGTAEEVKKAVANKKKNTIHRIFLSEEQQHVLNLVVEYKKSVFFTGSAGTGKSVLLREIIAALRKKYIREPDRIAVTASTGLAACNIGGVTLHSFAGIALGKESAEDLIKKVRRNQKAKQRWMRTKVLVVDEVSMVDGELFDKLEQIARTIRNNGRPFGGIQLIITGDFFQLPPVPEGGRQARFAFDAGTWNTAIEHTIGLHHVFRQKDPVFAGMLNEMREGRLLPESIDAFRKLDRPLPPTEDNIEATALYPTRSEVDRANDTRMQQLHGSTVQFEARDGGTITDLERRKKMLQNCMVPEQLVLKKGAQVMLVKNMDDTLVNGSLGKVIGFMNDQTFKLFTDHEEAFYEREGQDVDDAEKELRNRVQQSLHGVDTRKAWPVVRFAIADGTTRDLLCKPESWKVELPNGEVQASRDQIPLILAWALSIHKAQGQTLERVKVDLGKVFEKGQAYVALSRATNMGGLQVLRFDPKKVMAHEKVKVFYSNLARAEEIEGKTKSKTILGKMQASAK